jgi:TPR repeat protein|tara:strand:- start:2069 stop:2293 length:225 start_codon:yes stop_codon:yes gene_type:complete
MKSLLTTLLVLLALLAPLNASADLDKGSDGYRAGDYATALQEFKGAAEQGDASAQFNLGNMYRVGEAVISEATV